MSQDIERTIERLHKLKPGEKIIYFTGFLEYSRSTGNIWEADRIAQAAYNLAKDGKVLLTQRRLGPPVTKEGTPDACTGVGPGFEYIATGAYPRIRPQLHMATIIRKGGANDSTGPNRVGENIDGGGSQET